jgi:hypothetical protein
MLESNQHELVEKMKNDAEMLFRDARKSRENKIDGSS